MYSNINSPLVTIVSPCYNHSHYIIESLDSIKLQTYKNIEHIIIDDCSTDDSVTKIEHWIRENNYKCTFIKHKTNIGLSSTLNESILLCKGEYWSPLATDDIADHERTEHFVQFFMSNPQYDVVYSDCLLIDDESQPVKKNSTSSFIQYHLGFRKSAIPITEIGTFKSIVENNYISSSYMIKKSAFKKVGLYDTTLKMEDWDMWLRLSHINPLRYLDKQLGKYRFHLSNTVGSVKFLENYRDEVLIILYKAKSYCTNKQLLKQINNKIAEHIFLYLSKEQLTLKKAFFKQHNDLLLYYRILFLFYPAKIKLAMYKWYSGFADTNIIKRTYRSLKSKSKLR